MTFGEFCSLEAGPLGFLGWELHVTSFEFCTHCLLAMALGTKAGPPLSAASSCTTSLGVSPADSEDEHAGVWLDDLDEEDCLRCKPPWSAQSCMTCTKELDWSNDLDEDDYLKGKPLWSAKSYVTCTKEIEWSGDLEEDDFLQGKPLWSAQSYVAFEQKMEKEEEDEGMMTRG